MGHSSAETADGAAVARVLPDNWHRFGFEAYGVRGVIYLDAPEIVPNVETVLPPGWKHTEPSDDDPFFTLARRDGVSYMVEYGDGGVSGSSDLEVALAVLETRLRSFVAVRAPDHIFVHAGVVGLGGRAIIIPSPSFGGKTTLVTELIRAGAVYYSDEFAVLDADGMVHPYPKPLSIRLDGLNQVDHAVGAFGATTGVEPVPIGLVIVTSYVPGAQWRPERLSPGEAVLAMLANTVPAQERPAQALATIKRAIDGAIVLSSDRGEAGAVVAQVLDSVAP
jgi:hypothetical protein